MNKRMLSWAGVLFFSLMAAGCGQDEPAPAPAPAPDPRVIKSMTAEQRDRYCFVFAETESDDAAKSAFIEQLKGSWQHYPASTTDPADKRRTFKFDTDRQVVTVSEYSGPFSNITDIHYRKLCVSKPLSESHKAFSGFRLIEMLARDNEGAAALAVKIVPATGGQASPTLYLSDYYYERYAAKNEMLTEVSKVLAGKGGEPPRIWEYPAHRD